MVMFDFATAQRILFGRGRFGEVAALAAQYGRRVCLVTGGVSLEHAGHLGRLEGLFREAGLEFSRVAVTHEPTVELIDRALARLEPFAPEVVVAIGGGSVLDAGKALAALLANGGPTRDYLEGVGIGRRLSRPSLPCIAIPTTAGTGSEVTKNAVIADEARTFKKSLRSDWMLPAVALVDPDLTRDCPVHVAAACGMDALTQLLEAFTSRRANPLVDSIAGLGLAMASRLPRLAAAGRVDETTNEALAMASLLGGIALANAGLGAVHGLASPLGAFFPVPHGAVCAALLPAVVAANARRAAAEGDAMLLDKYAAAAIQLMETPYARGVIEVPGELPETSADEASGRALGVALALADYLRGLVHHLGLRGLGSHGIREEDFPRIIAGARGASMQTNPVTLSDEELERILRESL